MLKLTSREHEFMDADDTSDRERLQASFERLAHRLIEFVEEQFPVTDRDLLMAEATDNFARMLPSMPYRDQPEHIMANSMLFCSGVLAFHQPLQRRGCDAHALGRAAISMTRAALAGADPAQDQTGSAESVERQRRDGLESMRNAAEGEFVFEITEGDAEGGYGMNIKSCAICHAFSKHGAMDLVPYMCATDDVVSDALQQGLSRTGTIALGAGHCDFRFSKNSPGLPLAPQYPDRIRLLDA